MLEKRSFYFECKWFSPHVWWEISCVCYVEHWIKVVCWMQIVIVLFKKIMKLIQKRREKNIKGRRLHVNFNDLLVSLSMDVEVFELSSSPPHVNSQFYEWFSQIITLLLLSYMWCVVCGDKKKKHQTLKFFKRINKWKLARCDHLKHKYLCMKKKEHENKDWKMIFFFLSDFLLNYHFFYMISFRLFCNMEPKAKKNKKI